jgi:hypothetical protein
MPRRIERYLGWLFGMIVWDGYSGLALGVACNSSTLTAGTAAASGKPFATQNG